MYLDSEVTLGLVGKLSQGPFKGNLRQVALACMEFLLVVTAPDKSVS